MQITWYGQSCFKITSGSLSVVLNPFSKKVGLNPPRGKADIVLVSDSNKEESLASLDAGFVVSGEGEYEVKGVLITGFSYYHNGDKPRKSTVYSLEIEGISVCNLNSVSKEEIDGILDRLGKVDILMAPVGGRYELEGREVAALNAEEAVNIVGEIEPRIVIPMCYKIPKLEIKVDGVDKFLKAMGVSKADPMPKLTIKRKDLPHNEVKIVLLKTG